ncbi:MAG: diaminopimelate epimerase [Candidatus Omnitrophota bacterium]
MTGELRFTKMVASGNDFIVIDNRAAKRSAWSDSLPGVAKRLCERRLSVGADGVLVIEDSKRADFRMRIFNPDGSEVDMCGNGSRCAALYAVENNIVSKDMNLALARKGWLKIETGAGIIDAEVTGLKVKIRLTDPKAVKLNRKITIGKKVYKVHSINTGVPHAVVFLDNIDKVDVEALGSKLRFHKAFKPKGTNVDFVKIVNLKEIKVRTYERGVEAETYACGTGASASAIIANLIFGLRPHIDVITRSGEVLRVYFNVVKNKVKDIYLEGEANVVCKGGMTYV